MVRSVENPWLNRFAWCTAAVTLVLIGIGGLVTSKDAGMAVPDWPTTYGYNMFLFPISMWKGGIFYEHTHRLVASTLGLLTAILAIWLWLAESRRWLRWLGVAAFFAVVAQGVLGGLRVELLKAQLGIFHAALAQAFLVLVCAIAIITSSWWRELSSRIPVVADRLGLRRWFLFVTVLIFVQLALGATMRHQHAGLAIPDFPLAYHKLWPATDAASVASYNAHRIDVHETNPITAFQIVLQMVHRFVALLILCLVAFCAWTSRRQLGAGHPLARLSLVWLSLILAQVALGATTVLSGKAADIATLHVVVGAISLVNGAVLTLVAFRVLMPARAARREATGRNASGFVPGKTIPANAK